MVSSRRDGTIVASPSGTKAIESASDYLSAYGVSPAPVNGGAPNAERRTPNAERRTILVAATPSRDKCQFGRSNQLVKIDDVNNSH
jgi:hypothetical protein